MIFYPLISYQKCHVFTSIIISNSGFYSFIKHASFITSESFAPLTLDNQAKSQINVFVQNNDGGTFEMSVIHLLKMHNILNIGTDRAESLSKTHHCII